MRVSLQLDTAPYTVDHGRKHSVAKRPKIQVVPLEFIDMTLYPTAGSQETSDEHPSCDALEILCVKPAQNSKIGVVFKSKQGRTVVSNIFADSLAQRSGLQACHCAVLYHISCPSEWALTARRALVAAACGR